MFFSFGAPSSEYVWQRVLEIEGKHEHVQLVVLAGEHKKAYIPSPFKRWYGIGP